MKIRKLTIRNFRSYAEATYGLDRLNVIRGPNGAGKTAVQMAIEYALTGKCDVTDAGGRGADDLIRQGEAQLTVELDLEDGVIVQATRSSAGGTLIVTEPAKGKKKTGMSLSGQHARAALETRYAATTVLAAVLNAGRFLEMKPAEQRALLAAALRPEAVPVPTDIQTAIAELNLNEVTEIVHVPQVDACYKTAYEMRTQANRDLKTIGELAGPPDIPADMPALADVQKQLAELATTRTKKIVERTQAESAYKAADRRYLDANRRKAEILGLKKRLEGDILPDDEIDRVAKVRNADSAAAALDAKIVTLRVEIDAKGQAVIDWSRTPTKCDKCGAPLQLTQADIDEKIEGLQNELKDLNKQLDKAKESRADLGSPAEAAARLERHRSAVIQVSRADKEIEALYLDLGVAAGGEFQAPQPPSFDAVDSEIRTLAQRIADGGEVEKRIMAITAQQEACRSAGERRTEIEGRLERLEKLVEYFGPSGSLKAKLIAGRLPAFVDRINGVLGRFGFAADIDLGRPITVEDVGSHSKAKLQLHQLSESQKYRFGIALQVALAEATDVGLVIVDRADMLTPDARELLTQELLESRLEQAIVMATSTDARVPDGLPDGTAFFTLALNPGGVTLVYGGGAKRPEASYATTPE